MPVRVLGTATALPERIVGNDEIAAACGVTPAWIDEHVGFSSRRRAAPGETTSSLATDAASRALAAAALPAREVGLVIVATCSPDQPFPSTAAAVAARIGSMGAGAFDLEAGCAGFVHAFVLAAQSIALGTVRFAVVIGADTMSRHADPSDPTVAPIFGDGAGAAVLGRGDATCGLESACLGSDGEAAGLLGRAPGAEFLVMRGPALFRSAVRHSANAALEALGQAGLVAGDVDVVVPHQSSPRLLAATARAVGLPLERFVVNLDRLGNTSCASLPIALDEAVTQGRLRRGGRGLLLGFGAGLSWGAAVLRS